MFSQSPRAASSSPWVALAIFMASCGDGTADGTGGTGGVGSSSASLGCENGTLDASVDHIDLEHDGTERSYELHVPPAYDGNTPLPLVLNFHGFTSNGPEQRLFTGMDVTADANDFIVAYPNGISSSWNGGVCCGTAADEGIDDVGFTRAVVEDLGARGCIDRSRVYATGMSNGGFLSHRLACEASDIIAAVGPVAAVLGIDPMGCTPERPVPVIHFHGTEDMLVPYDGGGLASSISVSETFDGWAARNGCTDQPSVTFAEGMVTCEAVSECDEGASVTLCTVEGGGHCWPGRDCPLFQGIDLGSTTTDISANDAMWALFSTVTLTD